MTLRCDIAYRQMRTSSSAVIQRGPSHEALSSAVVQRGPNHFSQLIGLQIECIANPVRFCWSDTPMLLLTIGFQVSNHLMV